MPRRNWIFSLAAFCLLASNPAFAKTVYGDDDRVDPADVSEDSLVQLARSTVALFGSDDLKRLKSGDYATVGKPLGEEKKLCSGEPFADQVAPAECSGALVGDDLVLTAGHCVSEKGACASDYFVFDFGIYEKGSAPGVIAAENVYRCRKILFRVEKPRGLMDFALIQLDRKVSGRSPLHYREFGEITEGDSVFAIGYPTGLPVKIALNGQVRKVEKIHFNTNLDTFAGNSGSPVFDRATGLIEGLLIEGDKDFVKDPDQNCYRVKRCEPDQCKGEEVLKISEVLKALSGKEESENL